MGREGEREGVRERMREGEFSVICIEAGEDDDLAVGRVYRAREDAAGIRSGFIRVWDESGEDYLYPGNLFVRTNVAEGARAGTQRG